MSGRYRFDEDRADDHDVGIPFGLKATLDGPVMTDRVIHGDGLLLRMREIRDGEQVIGTPFPTLGRLGGIFQASAGFFAAPLMHRVVFTTHATVRGLKFGGRADDRYIVAEGRDRIVRDMDLRFRTNLTRYATIEGATAIYWQMRGNPDEALRLAKRIQSVGGRRNACYGSVVEWDVIECVKSLDPRDAGLRAHGRPLRNLPAAEFDGVPEGSLPEFGRLEPSYKATVGRTQVVAPTLRAMSGSVSDAKALFGFK